MGLKLRLDRFIAENTLYTRSEVKRLLGKSRVCLNGGVVAQASLKIDPLNDSVMIDNEEIKLRGHLYLMMNKPKGFISASRDNDFPTVTDILQRENHFLGSPDDFNWIQREQLQIVGRLDKDTTGLLLLTTDGDWNHKVSSPSSHCQKTYAAELAEPIEQSAIKLFSKGIQLKSEEKLTKPASLEIIDTHHVKISISEGRYHQVKRMFAAIGNRVVSLERLGIGPLNIDKQLKPGYFRRLSKLELDSINSNLSKVR